jgi:hypothetical protein
MISLTSSAYILLQNPRHKAYNQPCPSQSPFSMKC